MRQDGYFDKILATKKSESGLCVFYQIDTERPHLNGIIDNIKCVSWGIDAERILNGVRKGDPVSVFGSTLIIPFCDLDFIIKEASVFMCGFEETEIPNFSLDDDFIPDIVELVVTYHRRNGITHG